jgi:O-antigen/teichoic acid export membrane protein
MLASTAMMLLTSRWLGAEIRGEINILLIWVGFWAIFSDFVSGSVLINLSARFSPLALWKKSGYWVACISVCAGIIHWFWIPLTEGFNWVVPVVVFLSGMNNATGGLLIGLGKIVHRNYAFALISMVMLMIFTVVSLWTGGGSLDIYLYSWSAAWFLSTLVMVVYFVGLITGPKNSDSSLSPGWKGVFTSGFLSQSGHLIQYAFTRLPFLIVPYLYDKSILGVFFIVVVMGEAIMFIAASMGQELHAKVVHLGPSPDMLKRWALYTRVSILITGMFLVVLWVIPSDFWVVLLKEDFSELKKYIGYYSPAILCQAPIAVFAHFLHANNRFRELILANLLGLMVALMVIFLSYRLGFGGFVFGLVAGVFSQMVYLVVIGMRLYGASVSAFIPNRHTLSEVWLRLSGLIWKKRD